MLLEILPAKLKQVFENKVSLSDVSEIRLRVNKPVAVNVKGKLYYLAGSGNHSDKRRLYYYKRRI